QLAELGLARFKYAATVESQAGAMHPARACTSPPTQLQRAISGRNMQSEETAMPAGKPLPITFINGHQAPRKDHVATLHSSPDNPALVQRPADPADHRPALWQFVVRTAAGWRCRRVHPAQVARYPGAGTDSA